MKRLSGLIYKRIYVGLIIVLMLGTAFVGGCSSNEDEVVDSGEIGTKVGDTAPDFTLADLDGYQVSLSDFRDKAVFINFWAST